MNLILQFSILKLDGDKPKYLTKNININHVIMAIYFIYIFWQSCNFNILLIKNTTSHFMIFFLWNLMDVNQTNK